VAPGLLKSVQVNALLIFLGLLGAGLIIELWTVFTAPVGYQDESGFHFGPEQQGVSIDAVSINFEECPEPAV
jgi:hypothetical protein